MTKSQNNLMIALVYEHPPAYLNLGFTPAQIAHLKGAPADDITAALIKLGHTVIRIPDIGTLTTKLAAGEGSQWDLAVNVTEGVHGSAREAQVPAMLEAFGVPYTFSDSATMALCLDKGKTKMVFEHYGIPTSPFIVVNLDQHLDDVLTPKTIRTLIPHSKHAESLLEPSAYPLFAKPLAEHSSKGIKQSNVIRNIDDLCQVTEELRSSTQSAPAILIEKFLTGREFTVGILGTGQEAWVLGVTEMVWKSQPKNGNGDVPFATEKSKACDDWDGVVDEIPASRTDPQVELACGVALQAWRALGCRDAGRVDIRLDSSSAEQVANVLEINPIAGLWPGWSQLPTIAEHNGMSYDMFWKHVLQSALKRTALDG